MTSAAALLWASIYRDRLRLLGNDLTVATWADRYRMLSSESAAIYGKWRTYPFQRGPFEAVSDARISRVVIKSATQMLKTELILNAIGYFAHMDPGPMLILQPRDADAKAFSKERISPMIRDTPVLKAIFAPSKAKKADNTLEEKFFTGGMLAITSAGSPANLSRRAIRFLFCDEIDKYPLSAGPEGNPISLARKRTATFRHKKKEILTCSPTVAGSEIDRAYENSDKREFFVPCPSCGHYQSMMLKFRTNVRWDETRSSREEQAKTARYYCDECGGGWDDAARWNAVENGEWRATAPEHGIAGFWISELYSPFKTLGEIVLDYLTKKGVVEELKTFIQTSLAENWIEQGEAPEWETLLGRRDAYEPGTIPAGGLFLTAGVDVQRDRLEVEVVAWGRGKESWSVDYRIFEGRTSDLEVWKKLEEFRSKTYTNSAGAEIPIQRMFVDSGDGTTTNDVYSWVRSQNSVQVAAIKGMDSGIPIGVPTAVDVTLRGGKKLKHGLKIRTVNVSHFKGELYGFLKLRAPTAEELAQGWTFPPGFCHFPSGGLYGDEHFRQLCAEQLVTVINKRTKRAKVEWQQVRARNEALDCRIYARAAAYDLGLDRCQEKDWRNLERQMGVETPPPAAPVPIAMPAVVTPAPKIEPKLEPQRAADPWRQAPARRASSWLGERTRGWIR